MLVDAHNPECVEVYYSAICCILLQCAKFLADRTGLEPATSAVTGQHSNQLNYVPRFFPND